MPATPHAVLHDTLTDPANPFPDLPGTARLDATTTGTLQGAVRAWARWARGRFAFDNAEVAPAAWEPTALGYRINAGAALTAGSLTRTATAYQGGGLDWHSFDGGALGPPPTVPAVTQSSTLRPPR